jgi:hypothetical protein
VPEDQLNPDSAVTSEPAQPRAEIVGSLLRDDAVVRAARRSSPADNALLGDAVRDAIRLQEELGLDVISDGEVRRVNWAQTPRFVDAFTLAGGQPALHWQGATEGRWGAPATGAEIRRGSGYPAVNRRVATAPRTGDMAAEYAFLARYASTRTKFTLPAPSYHRRFWSSRVSPEAGYDSPRSATTCARSRTRSSTTAATTSSWTRLTTARCATPRRSRPCGPRAVTRRRSWSSTPPSTAPCLTG